MDNNVKVAKPLTHELTALQIQYCPLSAAVINGSLCSKSLDLMCHGRS